MLKIFSFNDGKTCYFHDITYENVEQKVFQTDETIMQLCLPLSALLAFQPFLQDLSEKHHQTSSGRDMKYLAVI